MTLKTWKAEFYQKYPTEEMDERDAIVHSLQKWIGLTEENLSRHGLEKGWGQQYICEVDGKRGWRDGSRMIIGAGSCALCVKYCLPDGNCGGPCIISWRACDARDLKHSDKAPYLLWMYYDDPFQ